MLRSTQYRRVSRRTSARRGLNVATCSSTAIIRALAWYALMYPRFARSIRSHTSPDAGGSSCATRRKSASSASTTSEKISSFELKYV